MIFKCFECGKDIISSLYTWEDYTYKATRTIKNKKQTVYFCSFTCRQKEAKRFQEEQEKRKQEIKERRKARNK